MSGDVSGISMCKQKLLDFFVEVFAGSEFAEELAH